MITPYHQDLGRALEGPVDEIRYDRPCRGSEDVFTIRIHPRHESAAIVGSIRRRAELHQEHVSEERVRAWRRLCNERQWS